MVAEANVIPSTLKATYIFATSPNLRSGKAGEMIKMYSGSRVPHKFGRSARL